MAKSQKTKKHHNRMLVVLQSIANCNAHIFISKSFPINSQIKQQSVERLIS